jgi:hypothetical protein
MLSLSVSPVLVVFVILGIVNPVSASGSAVALFPDPSCDFGKVLQGAVVEHAFLLKNAGSEPLRIQGVRMTLPLEIEPVRVQVEPGAETSLRFKLPTSTLRGVFEGVILVSINDPARPETTLAFQGIIVPEVEVSPQPAFWIAAQKGERKSSELEILNHGSSPLRIENVSYTKERFKTSLETVEDGKRFRLTLTLDPAAPAAKTRETITISTNNKKMPLLKIAVNINVRDRVYTFPEAVQLGALPLSSIEKEPGAPEWYAQTLMIYQHGGSDFQVALYTDIPALDLKWERGQKGDRFQVTVGLNRGEVRPGPIDGSIYIETNDPDFPVLTAPVTGRILEGG